MMASWRRIQRNVARKKSNKNGLSASTFHLLDVEGEDDLKEYKDKEGKHIIFTLKKNQGRPTRKRVLLLICLTTKIMRRRMRMRRRWGCW